MNRNEKNIIVVEHEPGTPFPAEWGLGKDYAGPRTDEEIAAAVADDPDAAPIECYNLPGFTHVVNVLKLRKRLGVTQEEFAARYKIPVGTLRDWEQHRKNPDAPARAYLRVIEANPEIVAKSLNPQAA